VSSFSSVSWPLKFSFCELSVITCTSFHSNPVIPHFMVAQETFLGVGVESMSSLQPAAMLPVGLQMVTYEGQFLASGVHLPVF